MKKYPAWIYNLLLIVSICSQLWAYLATYLNKEHGMEVLSGAFYQFNALTHLLLWVVLFSSIFLKSNKWTSRLIVTGMILAFNQFSDELWFGPYQIQLNEKLLGIFLCVYYFVEYFRENFKIEYLNEPLD
jgi:hypothetical protein